jgi:PAS domain S-box-containing protein
MVRELTEIAGMNYDENEMPEQMSDETMFLKINREALLASQIMPAKQRIKRPKQAKPLQAVPAQLVEPEPPAVSPVVSAVDSAKGMQVYQEFTQSVYDGVILTGYEGTILDANTRAAEFFLLEQEQLHELRITDLLIGADDMTMSQIVGNLNNNRRTVIEADCARSDNTTFSAEITVNVLHLTDEGQLCFFIRNITRRNEMLNALRESEQRFRDIAESMSDWIWQIDLDGACQFCTEKVVDILGYSVEDMVGKSLFEYVVEEHAEEATGMFQSYIQSGQNLTQLEVWMRGLDGDQRCISFSGCPVFNDREECTGYRGIASNVTDRKLKEQELDRYRHHLEELVRERTAEAVAAKEDAEAANRAKSDFLANMSHEIRTPMHGILSFANFGIKRIDRAEKENLLDFFQEIKDSGERLLHLLNDLLDLSKLEAGLMVYDRVEMELCSIVDTAVTQFVPLIQEKNLTINIEQPDFLAVAEVDENRIIQVISNLISNAIKFTPEGTAIDIEFRRGSIKRGDSINDAIEISITDQGIGISEEELETVFRKFTQSSHTHTAAGGTGLGLAICHEIVVNGHKGLIWAEPNPQGQGVVFITSLPVKRIEQTKVESSDH